MEVKAGYKQTEVGIIPEDWEVKILGEIVQYTNGKAHENSINEFGKYIVVNSKFISTDGEVKKYSDECFSPTAKGEILMVMSDVPNGRAIARCFFVEHNDTYTVNQRICTIRQSQINGRLLFYKLNRNPYYLAFDDGVKQTNLRKNDVLSCPIPCPPTLLEQEAIAEALSDADALIESLEQLITKKRQIKQGTMQELLTGKTRLEGFRNKSGFKQTDIGMIPEDWEAVNLSEVVKKFQNGYAFSSVGYVKSGMPIVTMAQIGLDGTFQFDEQVVNYWSFQEGSHLIDFQIFRGDLIIAMTDVTPEKNLIGRMTVVIEIGPLLLNQRVGLLRLNPEKIIPYFLCAFSNSSIWRSYSQAVASLGVQANIGTKEIRLGKVPLPTLLEQQAIASVLSDMDSEITALESKLEKARQVKHGMMHNLLTGRIRLV